MARSRGFTGYRTVNRLIALLGSLLIVSGALLGAITPAALAASSADTGFLYPSAAPDPEGWDSEDNGFADDDVMATSPGGNDSQGYDNFGFSFPSGTIIDGFEIQVEASSTDEAGCQLSVALSDDNGASFGPNEPNQAISTTASTLTFGGPTDVMGDDGSDGSDWDPATLEGGTNSFRLRVSAVDPGSSCTGDAALDFVRVKVYYRTFDDHAVANPGLASDICEAADFNFVIDMSGSIGPQGSNPSNLPDLIAGVNGFVTAFQNAGGDGRYSGTRFNDPDPKGSGTLTSSLTAGYVSAATFQTAVTALSGPTGWTPTAAGITAGLANNASDRAGVPNLGFIITDGSPNVPPSDSAGLPNTWLVAADAAIDAADSMRSAGYHVEAVYLSTAGDPGDTTLPFSFNGDAEWASKVMTEIGAGSFLPADFSSLAQDLLDELGCRPEVTIDKTADAGPFSAGDEIGFTVTLSNAGDPAEGLVVTDHLPAGVDWSEDPDGADWDIVPHSGHEDLVWIGGTLGKGTSSVHVSGLTAARFCGDVTNTAAFTTTNDGSGQATATLTVDCPDIDIEKTADPAGPVSAGDPIGFDIVVTNHGPGTAKGVVVSDVLPTDAGTSWSAAAPTGDTTGVSCGIAAGVLTCTDAEMLDDDSFTVRITSGTSAATVAASPVTNTASVTTTNDGSDTSTDDVVVQAPDLEVVKSGNGPLSAGETATFVITITNLGPGTARDVSVEDTLPDGPAWGTPTVDPDVANCVMDGNDLDCQLFDLAPGSVEISISGETTITDQCPDLPNEVTVGAANEPAGNVGPENSSEATIVVSCPNLGITKTALHEEAVLAGEDIGFRIDVVNSGEGSAFNVAVTDPLPDGYSWEITGGSSGWSLVGDLLTWGPGTILPEDSDAAREGPWVVVEAGTDPEDCGAVPNTARLYQGLVIIGIPLPADTLIGDDSATESLRCPAIGIDKQVEEGGESAEVGEEVEFTIDVSVSEGPVTTAVVTDTLPVGQTYVPDSQASSLPATFEVDGQVLSWTFASLDDGDPAVTITYGVTIDDGFGGQELINPAEVCVDEIELCEEDQAVVNVGSRFDVSIEKSNDAPPVGSLDLPTVDNGDTVIYTLDYEVFVEGLETDAFIVDLLPEGVTYVPDSATTDAQFTNVEFFPDLDDPLSDANDVSGTLVWTGSPAVTGSGSLTYKATADEDDPATEDVDEGGAAYEQPLVNDVEICLGEVDGETGEPGEQPILCDESASDVFVNEPPLALTPPPTDTIADRAPAASGPNVPLILILLGVLMLLVSLVTPAPAAARVRRDR